MDIWHLQSAIKRRRWFFLGSFLLALAVAVLIPRGSTEKVYISLSKVLLTPPTSAMYGEGRDMARWWFTDEATLTELVTSEELLRRVIGRLELKTDWTVLKERVSLSAATSESQGGYYRLGQSSSLFQIAVMAPDPDEARKLAEVVVDEFVASIQDLSAREFENTRRFLEDLVREARQNAEKTGNRLAAITSKRDVTSDERDVLRSLSELESERLSLKEQLTKLEAEASAVNDFLAGDQNGTPPWSLLKEEGAIRNLEQTVADTRVKLVETSQYFTPDSPEVREQSARLEKVQQLYQAQVARAARSVASEKGTEAGALQKQLDEVQKQIDALRATRLTPDERREVAKLERELNVWEENRLALIRQLYQARVIEQSSRRQGAIAILLRPTQGTLPRDKRLPSLVRSFAVGIPFALIVSLGLLILVEFLQRSLQLLPRIEQSLEAPILVVVPRFPKELVEDWNRIKQSLEPAEKPVQDPKRPKSWR